MISIMFHSAGLNDLRWRSAHISDPLDIIRYKLEIIRDEGYTTISMGEAIKNIGNKRDNLVHLSFDDGYLDNWVHVFPLLREFGHKATIFMTADFVDSGESIREQKKLSVREHDPKGCCAGFLSFREMREMESSGLIEIQSHALTHTWYFKGPGIVDFWHPGSATEPFGPVWMIWNRFPEKKPFYLVETEELEKMIPYGTPIYEHGKSLESVRFFPDEKQLEERLIDHVTDKPDSYFQHTCWRAELSGIVDEYRKECESRGSYESEEEYRSRVRHELSESKRQLENGLGHEIPGLCLPGGGVSKYVIKAARESGYRYFTLPGRMKGTTDTELIRDMIPRIGNLPRVTLKGRDLGYPTRSDFRYYLRMNNGYNSARLFYDLGRLRKLLIAG